MKTKIVGMLSILLVSLSLVAQETSSNKWTVERAEQWYAQQDWLNGANFIPSTAINQLEMWQADTFDPVTIERELGYAQGVGMNVMRVYLHSLAYQQDPRGFKERVSTYLNIADSKGIQTMFVIFDDVWGKEPKIGKQPEPEPGTHNSGWMQDPGDPASKQKGNFAFLETYVKDLLRTFGEDDRILLWDLYNEPGNSGKGNESMPLLEAVFSWAREVNPSQPLSAGIWSWGLVDLNAFQALHSDIITYHHYGSPEDHMQVLQLLKTHGRPMICTEYMARTRNSRFANTMPMLKNENIGAINWGLVNGKSNTIFEWDTPVENGEEPLEWFHDIFRKDGTPYREDEIRIIKKMNTIE